MLRAGPSAAPRPVLRATRGGAPPVEAPAPRRLGHRPALDGLRGAAWAVVFASHAFVIGWAAFGQVAMAVFFALSGFLITQVLLEERFRRGAVSVQRFFARRALRLVPALVVFLAAWLLAVAFFGSHGWMSSVPGSTSGGPLRPVSALEGAGAAMAYLTNWWTVLGLFPHYVPIGHLWSLAVEEQFYLVWAPVVAIAAWRGRWLGRAVVALTIASLADVVLVRHASSLSVVVDMGTDARGATFLMGAGLAVAWSSRQRWLDSLARRWRPLAVVSLGAMAWVAVLFEHPTSVVLFSAAWVILAVGCFALLLSVLALGKGAGGFLEHPVLTYLGRRSYALYLWHYVWLTWLHGLGLLGVVLALAASLGCAEASWRLVERRALSLKDRLGQRPTKVVEPASRRDGGTEVQREIVELARA